MTWVLLLFIGATPPVESQTVPGFASKAACEAAATEVRKVLTQGSIGPRQITHVCVPSGP